MKAFVRRGLFCLAALSLVVGSAGKTNAGVIDNFAIDFGFIPFGEPNIAYFGQTFNALPGLARELTFIMFSHAGPDGTDFRVLLTEIAGDPILGIRPTTVLFESGDLTLHPGSGSTFFTVDFGGIDLVDGATHAWILDAFVAFDGIPGTGAVDANTGKFPDGNFIFFNATGLGRTSDFNNNWGVIQNDDLAFSLTFTPAPIPEPGTLLLLGSGVVGMGAVARRRSRR